MIHTKNTFCWKEIKIECKTNNMSNWAQQLDDRLSISSVLGLIPYFGFFHGVDRSIDERTHTVSMFLDLFYLSKFRSNKLSNNSSNLLTPIDLRQYVYRTNGIYCSRWTISSQAFITAVSKSFALNNSHSTLRFSLINRK